MRTIDELGRIVLPINLRRKLNIKPYDELEFIQNGDEIIVRKVSNTFDLEDFLRKFIVYKYGNYFKNITIDKVTSKEIEELLCKYFDEKLVNEQET